MILRQAVMPPVSPRAKPCRLAPAGEGHAPCFAPLPVFSPAQDRRTLVAHFLSSGVFSVSVQHCSQIKRRAGQSRRGLVASGVAYKELLNQPVVAEVMAREQPEHLREYFMERVRHYRQLSTQLPNANDPRYIEMAEANGKGK